MTTVNLSPSDLCMFNFSLRAASLGAWQVQQAGSLPAQVLRPRSDAAQRVRFSCSCRMQLLTLQPVPSPPPWRAFLFGPSAVLLEQGEVLGSLGTSSGEAWPVPTPLLPAKHSVDCTSSQRQGPPGPRLLFSLSQDAAWRTES